MRQGERGSVEWLGTASGVRAASMAGVNSEGRDFINMHASPWCPPCPDASREWSPSYGGGNRSAVWKGAGEKCVGGWC